MADRSQRGKQERAPVEAISLELLSLKSWHLRRRQIEIPNELQGLLEDTFSLWSRMFQILAKEGNIQNFSNH